MLGMARIFKRLVDKFPWYFHKLLKEIQNALNND